MVVAPSFHGSAIISPLKNPQIPVVVHYHMMKYYYGDFGYSSIGIWVHYHGNLEPLPWGQYHGTIPSKNRNLAKATWGEIAQIANEPTSNFIIREGLKAFKTGPHLLPAVPCSCRSRGRFSGVITKLIINTRNVVFSENWLNTHQK